MSVFSTDWNTMFNFFKSTVTDPLGSVQDYKNTLINSSGGVGDVPYGPPAPGPKDNTMQLVLLGAAALVVISLLKGR